MTNNLNFKEISVYKGPERSPGFLLWHISTTWRSTIEAVLKNYCLTHPQFVVLATLGWLTRNGDPVTQVAIGRMAGLDPNTTSQIIKGLEQKELVKREQSSDGRAKNTFLTRNGSQILSVALPAVEKGDAQFFENLSPKEMESMINIFHKLIPHEQ
ncbi:MAG: MarR family transcriptional regulator [Parachlamydiaceae bacterium]|nr:MarR family transcriptional regulator [Parachlamydiaceae bacterium]